MKSEPITLQKICELVEKLEPKTIYMNSKTYTKVLELLDFKPNNVVVNNFLEDNQTLVLNETQKERMNKVFLSIESVR